MHFNTWAFGARSGPGSRKINNLVPRVSHLIALGTRLENQEINIEAPKSEARKTEVSSYTNVGVKRKTVTFGRTKIKVKRRNKIQNRLDKRYWALKENRNIPAAKIMSYHVFVRSYLAKGK